MRIREDIDDRKPVSPGIRVVGCDALADVEALIGRRRAGLMSRPEPMTVRRSRGRSRSLVILAGVCLGPRGAMTRSLPPCLVEPVAVEPAPPVGATGRAERDCPTGRPCRSGCRRATSPSGSRRRRWSSTRCSPASTTGGGCTSPAPRATTSTATSCSRNPPDVIRCLEDTDGDGRFDRSTVFADRLTYPQGVLWHDGAVYTASPPSLWRLEDTDGDGVADRRTELVTGFPFTGIADDLHGPCLGPDGRLYWGVGRFDYAIRKPGGPVDPHGARPR